MRWLSRSTAFLCYRTAGESKLFPHPSRRQSSSTCSHSAPSVGQSIRSCAYDSSGKAHRNCGRSPCAAHVAKSQGAILKPKRRMPRICAAARTLQSLRIRHDLSASCATTTPIVVMIRRSTIKSEFENCVLWSCSVRSRDVFGVFRDATIQRRHRSGSRGRTRESGQLTT